MAPSDPLDLFLPSVRHWFRQALGAPTPAQRQGWPAIAVGQNTLILAPTGSGKTLAAFLACLDGLWRQDPLPRGVQVLYISPLKALNNDIHRNLQAPLEGVAAAARELGLPLPTIEAAVRTGDTPAAERQRLLRKPPHVLITTPESLHILLTSRARDTLRGVTHCIVDEIHALCPNKRGVFLSLLLERLEAINPKGFVRIGLSATQRPLDEVARFLGGLDANLQPRPVTIVDAGVRRDLDLKVVCPVEHFAAIPERSVWPGIYRLLRDQIQAHRSTIVFANNRRTVERITAQLNEEVASDEWPVASEESGGTDDSPESSSLATDHSSLATTPLARAHHGSVSLEVRQQTELALKEGRLPAVVATASLELGIDMGAVDLVCQVESPGSVARGLQRVGRAGHVVGQKSKGRLIPKTAADLLEQAVLARAMAAGQVEAITVPVNCLDVLAQQVVAIVAMEPWDVPDLYSLIRRAYPFRDLTPQAFEAVLEMVSGRFAWSAEPRAPSSDQKASSNGEFHRAPRTALHALTPRVSWDRTHNRLHALPGSQSLALLNGGTIPDTGQYAAYTRSGVRIGELDEEFVYERRLGDAFLLGTSAWRIGSIEADRVLVEPAEGAPAMVPFWRGEQSGRSFGLGMAMGGFLRALAGRLDAPDCLEWLKNDYFLDEPAARNLRAYVRRQLAASEVLPTDRTLVVEACRDPLGDWQVILLSPLGNQLHLTLKLAIEARLRQRLGYRPQCLHHADGILIRQADAEEPIVDLFEGLTAENVEPLILEELADSALFALRFRQNAARALLMPRPKMGKRAPLWLQRLRGRDLLQVAGQHPDFPIVVETFRECLHDHLDVPRLKQLLADIRTGEVKIQTRRAEAPSPFASGMLFAFTAANMYEFDRTEHAPSAPLNDELLNQLTVPDQSQHLLDARAVQQVERRLRGFGQPPRSAAEMAEWLRRLGDLAPGELEGPMAEFLNQLEADGRARLLELPGCRAPQRWVLAEEEENYRQAFLNPQATADERRSAAETILARFLDTHALVGLADVLDRYPFERTWAQRQLEAWAESGRLVTVATDQATPVFSAPENLSQVRRGTLAILRQEVQTCAPPQFADFVLRWQGLTGRPEADDPAARLAEVLDRLEGLALPAPLWEQIILPSRLPGYQPRWLDQLIGGGAWTWAGEAGGAGEGDVSVPRIAFWQRAHQAKTPPPASDDALEATAERVLEQLQGRGASFVVDLAQETKLAPSAARKALWQLLRRRLVTNDSFDVIRRGEPVDDIGRHTSPRRRVVPDSRWSLLPWGRPSTEEQAVFLAGVLLHRHGVVARELALMDPGILPWRVLYEVLSRMEMTGAVRRGYFVEGLSGAQFALPEAARLLQDSVLPSTASAPVVLVHSLDPANLYGSGAPFDIPLLDGGTRPLLRRPGNWLLLRAGRPVLIAEQHGKRLTALASASRDEIAAAVARLPDILKGDQALASRRKLNVAEWNGEPVTGSAGRELLEAAGFVRDYMEMTLYGMICR